jgi:hypothetical protein
VRRRRPRAVRGHDGQRVERRDVPVIPSRFHRRAAAAAAAAAAGVTRGARVVPPPRSRRPRLEVRGSGKVSVLRTELRTRFVCSNSLKRRAPYQIRLLPRDERLRSKHFATPPRARAPRTQSPRAASTRAPTTRPRAPRLRTSS